MKIYTVEYVSIIERKVQCAVEAESEEEAIQKAKDGDIIDDDEDSAPEDCIEVRDHRIVEEEE